jgi:hypothetical protein|tara:strand:- start:935 stop:1183 length:249 start_codon:yes stop_codon:yes gene_type:complete
MFPCKIYDGNGKLKKTVKGEELHKAFWSTLALKETKKHLVKNGEKATCKLCKKEYIRKTGGTRYCNDPCESIYKPKEISPPE